MATARKLTPTEARVAAEAATPANRALVEQLFPANARGELPGVPWFALGTYRAVSQWAAVDWFVAISIRHAQWMFLMRSQELRPQLPIATVAHFIKGLADDPVTGRQAQRQPAHMPTGLDDDQ